MRSTRIQFATTAVTVGALLALIGCAGNRTYSVDGLYRADIEDEGILELRDNHGVGGYDDFLIPLPTLAYERDSQHFTDQAAERYVEALRQTIVTASEAAELEVREAPGLCTLQIDLRTIDLRINDQDRGRPLAELTLVMEFRDSVSGQPLLRYARQHVLPFPPPEVSTDTEIRRGLTGVIRDMNISTSLRGADIASSAQRFGCEGTLGARGRAARRAANP